MDGRGVYVPGFYFINENGRVINKTSPITFIRSPRADPARADVVSTTTGKNVSSTPRSAFPYRGAFHFFLVVRRHEILTRSHYFSPAPSPPHFRRRRRSGIGDFNFSFSFSFSFNSGRMNINGPSHPGVIISPNLERMINGTFAYLLPRSPHLLPARIFNNESRAIGPMDQEW